MLSAKYRITLCGLRPSFASVIVPADNLGGGTGFQVHCNLLRRRFLESDTPISSSKYAPAYRHTDLCFGCHAPEGYPIVLALFVEVLKLYASLPQSQ